MQGLKRRLAALETEHPECSGPGIWIILEPGETEEQGLARWEAENGPRAAGQPAVVWHIINTGVPRGPDSVVRS